MTETKNKGSLTITQCGTNNLLHIKQNISKDREKGTMKTLNSCSRVNCIRALSLNKTLPVNLELQLLHHNLH